ncbi:MAG TPA: DUF4383 domain-containing protein [Waddliaceae bacterium]
MLRTLAIIFGLILAALGIIGFIPTYVTDGKLFNIFLVNLEGNVVHLASGIIAILCGLSSGFASKMFFIIFGVIYGFLAFLGFMQGHEGMLFDMIAVNMADNWLHAGIAAVSLLIGFGFKY